MLKVHNRHIINKRFLLNPESDYYQIEYTEKVAQETIYAYNDLFNSTDDINAVLIFNDMTAYADTLNIGTASENAIAKMAIYSLLDHMQAQINLNGFNIFEKKGQIDE